MAQPGMALNLPLKGALWEKGKVGKDERRAQSVQGESRAAPRGGEWRRAGRQPKRKPQSRRIVAGWLVVGQTGWPWEGVSVQSRGGGQLSPGKPGVRGRGVTTFGGSCRPGPCLGAGVGSCSCLQGKFVLLTPTPAAEGPAWLCPGRLQSLFLVREPQDPEGAFQG